MQKQIDELNLDLEAAAFPSLEAYRDLFPQTSLAAVQEAIRHADSRSCPQPPPADLLACVQEEDVLVQLHHPLSQAPPCQPSPLVTWSTPSFRCGQVRQEQEQRAAAAVPHVSTIV
eukprot:755302-Hanusia_phi.AAC.2